MARIAFIDVTVTVMYGGLQTAVWRFAETLSRLGHEVHVYGGIGGIAPPADCAGVRVHSFPFRPRERVLDLGSRFQRIVERATFARHARTSVIAAEHDWVILDKPFDFFWPWFMPKNSKTRFAFTSGGTDFFAGDRRLVRRVDVLLACSHFNAWQIRSHYKQPVGVVHYGVNTARFAPRDAAAMRARLGVSADIALFVFAGRLVGWKGMTVAVRALTEPVLRGVPVKLLIVGDGPERSQLEALARELNVTAHVIFHDSVPHDSLPDYYAAADVGVFPSIGDEAFGITIAEAMSCAKPVIGGYVGGIPEVVGNEESCGLLVPPGDSAALAQAMRRLADDAALRTRLGIAARTRIERLYTWDMSAQRLLAALGLKSDATHVP